MEIETPSKRHSIRRAVREFAKSAVLAIVLYALLNAIVGRYEILNVSMEPNFHEGQVVMISRLDHVLPPWQTGVAHADDGKPGTTSILQRGQVVVFYPTNVHAGTPLVKRVIGLPGDVLTIANGQVTIDGQALAEPYLHGVLTQCQQSCNFVLAAGQYFMMGDNRSNSYDSRSFGPVAEANLIGHVIVRYWPLDKVEFYP